MKTLKEINKELFDDAVNIDNYKIGYYEGYKTAIELIFNDIVNSQATSVENIEKYLQDLMNK